MRLIPAHLPQIFFFWLALFFSLLSKEIYAQALNHENRISPYLKVYTIPVIERDSVFITDPAILSVDTVFVSHANYTEEIPYQFDLQRKRIIVPHPLEIGSSLIIHAYSLPFTQNASFAKRAMVFLRNDTVKTETSSGVPVENKPPDTWDAPSLFKSGSLTRSFSFGSNTGIELRSGLNMQIRGKLGKNYELRAVLTDQNVPLQPEGNTRTLNEIDKVFIDIKGPGVSSRFGDFYLEQNRGQFASVSKKLTGVSMNSTVVNNDISFSVATSEGQYHSMHFLGIEGNQGPYLLTGENGERLIIVLAGTEKVYVDGSLMTRGEDNDYVIDYASAQVTFTRNRLVTGDSRIVVDFHYSDGNFKKSFYSVGINKKVQNRGFNYSASFIRESDNKENPQAGSFSHNVLSNISNAGDNPILAAEKSIEYVGPGEGTYNKVSTSSEEYFEYADSAEYKVRFSSVGEGNGEYEFQRLGIYKYVGENNGRYSPAAVLPLPKSHTVTNFSLGYRDDENPVYITTEYAVSMLDKNILSARDDGDNQGDAFAVELGIQPSQLQILGSSLGSASVTAKIRRTTDEFKPVDRSTEVEFDRRWDLDRQTVSGENIFEIEADYKPAPFISIKPSAGTFRMGDGFRSDRQSALVRMYTDALPKMEYLIENISRETTGIKQDWIRQKGSISYVIKNFTPSVIFEKESKKNNEQVTQGFGFQDIAGKLQYNRNKDLKLYSIFQIREDEQYDQGILQPFSRSENKSLFLEYKQGSRFFSRLNVVRRTRTFHKTGGELRTNLADLKTQSSLLRGALRTRMDIQMSREKLPQKEKVYFSVDEGHGSYSFDERSQEYIPDPDGSIELRTFSTDNLVSVQRKKVGFTLHFDPARLQNTSPSFQGLKFIRSTTILRYENSERDENPITSAPESGGPIFRLINISQDTFFWEKNESFNLRLRNNVRKTDNNQFIARSESRDSFEHSLRIRSRLNKTTTIESTLEIDRLMKIVLNNDLLNHNIRTVRGDITLTARPQIHWRMSLTALGAQQKDSISEFSRVTYFSIKPVLEKGFLNSGRITSDAQWFHVQSNQGDYLPFDFAEGNQPGNNYAWSLIVDYRTTQNFNTSLRYFGNRKKRNDKTFHNMRAELQMLF